MTKREHLHNVVPHTFEQEFSGLDSLAPLIEACFMLACKITSVQVRAIFKRVLQASDLC